MESVSTLWAKCEKREKRALWSHNETNFISSPVADFGSPGATKLGKAEASSAECGVDP